MFKNLRRLVLLHISLGICLIVVYRLRPGAIGHPVTIRDRAPFALSVIGMVLLAWAPFLISGFYACSTLVERNPKAIVAFSWSAIAIFIVAACLSLNLGGFPNRPSNFAISLGVTIALLAAARLCCSIWKAEIYDLSRE
jgi:hypothetical protein